MAYPFHFEASQKRWYKFSSKGARASRFSPNHSRWMSRRTQTFQVTSSLQRGHAADDTDLSFKRTDSGPERRSQQARAHSPVYGATGSPDRRSSGVPSDRANRPSRDPPLDEARFHHPVGGGAISQVRDCRLGQRERVYRAGDHDSGSEFDSVARRVPPNPDRVFGWCGEDGTEALGDQGSAHEGQEGPGQLLREETGIHGDRRRGPSCYEGAPLFEITTFAPNCPLPRRNWVTRRQ
ncbi:hypothetical protein BWQ96_09728 [Gracilariopsis chorda]|uniref:Uncharacterized protein n=1 Tax=Gracilariopsis chorda TaxID=448386 RepID=A0A2V3IER1_9FLOR|nr:hypothetical protein BWQ96_09728 [Gracilariopsis chorda]|eukprot:PXF40554.1 hypothetical protein BWQ96_09728 [Gracilariopsis chorda]